MFAKLKSIREEQESGFTLIELLVVILIIGILAAIAIPMFMNQRKSAVDSSVQSDVKNAATAIETWAVKNPSSAVTGFTIGDDSEVLTVAGTAPTDPQLLAIKVGSGTELTVTPNGVGAYKIKATNKGGDAAKATSATAGGITYDSALGGLNK